MPLQFSLAYTVYAFQIAVRHPAQAPDASIRRMSIGHAINMGIFTLEQAIDELQKKGQNGYEI